MSREKAREVEMLIARLTEQRREARELLSQELKRHREAVATIEHIIDDVNQAISDCLRLPDVEPLRTQN